MLHSNLRSEGGHVGRVSGCVAYRTPKLGAFSMPIPRSKYGPLTFSMGCLLCRAWQAWAPGSHVVSATSTSDIYGVTILPALEILHQLQQGIDGVIGSAGAAIILYTILIKVHWGQGGAPYMGVFGLSSQPWPTTPRSEKMSQTLLSKASELFRLHYRSASTEPPPSQNKLYVMLPKALEAGRPFAK